MLRKFWFLVVVLGMALPGFSADRFASISGYVRSSQGVPQMGALVEVLGSAFHSVHLFTDENGFYSATGILPGIYDIKVSAPSFLPSLRERIGLRPGSASTINITLSTLFDAIQFGPIRDAKDQDDWKWVLRSSANRPALRIFSGAPLNGPADQQNADHDLTGTLSFVAGSNATGYGSNGDMSAAFRVERSMFASGTMAISGNLGYGDSIPAGVVRASYTHRMSNGSVPQVALTVRHFASPDGALPNSSLQAAELTTGDELNFANVVRLKFGSELETVQFMGRVTSTFRPYGSAEMHLSPDTVLEYAYSGSAPNAERPNGFDPLPAELSQPGPRMSIMQFSPELERVHHHEVSVSHRAGKTNVQVAFFADRVSNPALVGVGEFSSADGNVLADPNSGTFTYRGGDLDTRGMRLVLERKIAADLKATLDYEAGGVLDIGPGEDSLDSAASSMIVRNRQSVAGKLTGDFARTKTRWAASYRWINGQALTPVDMFNVSPGQADPFLNLFIRQPIPGTGFLPGHMEAVIDLSNLLAQGYVPMMGQDGRTVYLVQSARTVRGGLAFSF
jgi:hypothetical protein